MLDFNTRLTNLEGTISYLYNNFNPPSDIEVSSVREDIFDRLNVIINEVEQIKTHLNLLSESLLQIQKERK
jgi:hypothetical protein